MRRIPIGVSDYRKMIEENLSYIDKTLLIEEICSLGTEVIVLPRPRRFGKTLNLSMLRYFFEKTQEDLSHLFRNYKIWQTEYQTKHAQYPVIFLSLKKVKGETWQQSYESLKSLIGEEFQRHEFLLKALHPDPLSKNKKEGDLLLSETELKKFQSILDGSGSLTLFEDSLKMLSLWLKRYYKKNAYILIDEYDAPIHAAYLNDHYKPMIDFMRNWLSEGLKDNPSIEKGILTGILRVSKESIFSGFNNPGCYTILNERFCDKFGLLENEVEALLKEHNISHLTEEIRSWYNGYKIGPCSLYNPWSILQCIDSNGELKPYWVNTSDNNLIKKLLLQAPSSVKKEVEKLLLGESIIKPIDEAVSFDNLSNNSDAIFGLFLFSGYLTLVKKPVYENEALRCELKIPNKEIYSLYKSTLIEWMTNMAIDRNVPLLLEHLLTGNVTEFTKGLQAIIINSMSFHDMAQKEPERVYHAFVLGLLVTLTGTHEVKSNRESGLGRYDVCIIPKELSALGVVMEFKKVEEEKNLEEGSINALEQIQKKQYAADLQQRGIKEILLLGIAFHGKSLQITSKKIHTKELGKNNFHK